MCIRDSRETVLHNSNFIHSSKTWMICQDCNAGLWRNSSIATFRRLLKRHSLRSATQSQTLPSFNNWYSYVSDVKMLISGSTVKFLLTAYLVCFTRQTLLHRYVLGYDNAQLMFKNWGQIYHKRLQQKLTKKTKQAYKKNPEKNSWVPGGRKQ